MAKVDYYIQRTCTSNSFWTLACVCQMACFVRRWRAGPACLLPSLIQGIIIGEYRIRVNELKLADLGDIRISAIHIQVKYPGSELPQLRVATLKPLGYGYNRNPTVALSRVMH